MDVYDKPPPPPPVAENDDEEYIRRRRRREEYDAKCAEIEAKVNGYYKEAFGEGVYPVIYINYNPVTNTRFLKEISKK